MDSNTAVAIANLAIVIRGLANAFEVLAELHWKQHPEDLAYLESLQRELRDLFGEMAKALKAATDESREDERRRN